MNLVNEPLPIVTLLTIAITAIVSYVGFGNARVVEGYLFSTDDVLSRRQYYRLFTSGLLHADWIHLLFNMFSLYSFARYIELFFGPISFLTIYLSSILGGNLLALVVHRHHHYHALGASGGVCGIIFASIFLLPGGGVIVFPIPVSIPSWLYAIVFILGSYIGLRKGSDNIGHDAHLGGAIIGLLVTTALYPPIVGRHPILYATVLGLAGLLLAYTYRWPMFRSGPAVFTRKHWAGTLQNQRERKQAKRDVADQQRLDQLLEKVSQSGLHSLSEAEKRELTAISQRRNNARR